MHVEVGQVIYVLDAKRHTLVPCQVNERLVSKTLKGKSIHHVLSFTNDKQIVLEDLKTPWFTDLREAKTHLLREAEAMIDKIAEQAHLQAADSFGVSNDPLEVSLPSGFTQPAKRSSDKPLEEAEAGMKIDLGDGVVGNLKLPKEFLDENPAG